MKIGFILDIAGEGPHATPAYQKIREMAQAAEEAGLDSIWLYDHLLFRFGDQPTQGIWECWTTLAALAEATRRVELGTLVLCSPFRNPALLAKMAVTLDEVSGGRLILGLGAGWHRPEFDAFGYPFDHRVDRFEEAVQIIAPLLREGRVDFRGRWHRAEACEILPRGPRPAGPPLLIAAFGPRMLRIAARHADLWNHAWLGRAAALAEPQAALAGACAEVGRDPATLGVTVGVHVAFPDLGDVGQFNRPPLGGSATELAEALAEYRAAGVAHLMCNCMPYGLPALRRLAEAARLSRALA